MEGRDRGGFVARADTVGRITRAAAVVISIGLGAMILVAALLKAADPGMFVEQIRGYNILPSMADIGAVAFIWVEVIIGLALILRIFPRYSLFAFILLMALFIGVTAYTWAQGNTSGCGCFGRLASRPPREVILEDAIYVALAAFAFRVSPWMGGSRPRYAAFAVVLPFLIASPWIAPRLPVERWVLPLRPGVSIENLAVDGLRVPLGEGRVFVAFLGDPCPECAAALPAMNALAHVGDSNAPRVTGIFAGDSRAKRTWALEHIPAFPLGHTPEKVLRQYYRTLPVFLLVEEGTVRRVWYGRMPSVDEVLREAAVTPLAGDFTGDGIGMGGGVRAGVAER